MPPHDINVQWFWQVDQFSNKLLKKSSLEHENNVNNCQTYDQLHMAKDVQTHKSYHANN